MLNFFLCGIVFLFYSFVKFKRDKIFYPSVVFSFMWGGVCMYTAAILSGYGKDLYLKNYYVFHVMDTYIIYFTIAMLLGFILAHCCKKSRYSINLMMDLDFINKILSNYKWIMWLNFFCGVLRIIIMVSTVGIDNMMDYRAAANAMMMTSSFTFAGIVFKLTAYVQMLANFYVGLYGLKTGFDSLKLKKTIVIFLLYAPTQMATGGRLFILYFILFFFGAFLLGRGFALRSQSRNLLEQSEKKVLILSFAVLLSLVGIIAMVRGIGIRQDKETTLEKFAYITEGMLATEYLMNYYPKGTFQLDYGENTSGNLSQKYLKFRRHLRSTKMSSVVVCIFTPLYLDFGYWGSLIVLFILAFVLELFALKSLNKMGLINFFIYMIILKILYESVMAQSISENLPNYELILLFVIFYKRLFGRFEVG